jgi:hypothetical protein
MTWPTRPQSSGETIRWALDVADRLQGEATIVSVGAATLVNVNTGQAHAEGLSGASSTTATEVRQIVTALQAGHRYRLLIPFTDSDGNTQEAGLILECLH